MDTKMARRKTFDVEYVEVTEENMEEISQWSDNPIGGEGTDRFIQITDKNAMNARQTKAFIGDLILKSGSSFKAYSKKAFAKAFEDVEVIEHARNAKTGEYVTDEEAAANPESTVIERDVVATENLRSD